MDQILHDGIAGPKSDKPGIIHKYNAIKVQTRQDVQYLFFIQRVKTVVTGQFKFIYNSRAHKNRK